MKMSTEGEVCLICDKVPCQCVTKRTRRRSSQRATPASPSPAVSTETRRVVKRSLRATSAEATTKQSEQPVAPQDPAPDDAAGECEDAQFVYAVRQLAHLIRPDDPNLAAMGDLILPSDRLPPEERIPDWKRRVGGS